MPLQMPQWNNPLRGIQIVKKLHCLLIVAIAASLLSGCLDNGSKADPPANFAAIPGDGRVILTWTPNSSVSYWVFTATDPSLSAFNWSNLANAHAYTSAGTPFYMCGLMTSTVGSPTPYYFAANGRSNGGPGGASSPTISATPYNAIDNAITAGGWTASPVPSTANLYGVGYASLTTCSNSTTSAAGNFAAVGAGGAIFTSVDGKTWSVPTSVPPVLPDLYAVTGNAVYLNNPASPGLLWIAVGAGGASAYSYDGISWVAGGASNATPNSLRSITHFGSAFIAVGDMGTIVSTSDGITWAPQTSGTNVNLLGVTHGNFYTAVGENGTILTSSTGGTSTWVPQPVGAIQPLTPQTLRQVATYGNITVAVGDNGTIVTSVDNGHSWAPQNLPNFVTPDLVSIAVEFQVAAPGTAIDPVLSAVPYAQFVAMDSSGNAYTSVNGVHWSGPFSTGITSNALVSSGFGYVAAGNAGATAYAF
jgi:photosystem II stability/assembly factor-like uncharacterized protein